MKWVPWDNTMSFKQCLLCQSKSADLIGDNDKRGINVQEIMACIKVYFLVILCGVAKMQFV